MKIKPIEVKALEPFRIWVKFSDNVEGILDYGYLAGKGVFKKWNDEAFFKNVFINEEAGCVAWEGEIDLDPVQMYHEVAGISIEESLEKIYT